MFASPVIAAGSSANATTTVTIPASATAGSHSLCVEVAPTEI
jgi:hypothetical protein